MADTAEILSVLKELLLAYPEKKIEREGLLLYTRQLSDIPLWLLQRTVQEHIATSPWFPHVSDLRNLAQRLGGTTSFAALPPAPLDDLARRAYLLEQAFYQSGTLEPEAWQALAQQFERCERPYRAAYTLIKYQRLAAIQDQT